MLMKTLEELRKEIDEIDHELLQILTKRLNAVKQVVELKNIAGITVLDEKRREELLKSIKEKAKDLNLSEDFVEKLFETIHDHSVELQKK